MIAVAFENLKREEELNKIYPVKDDIKETVKV